MAEINLVIKSNPSQAIGAVKEFNNTLKDTSKESAKSQQAIGDLTNNLNFMGVSVGQLTGAFQNKISAIGKVTKAFGVLKTAILGTGIGALIIAIGSLVAYFTKTEKGAELLERAMAGLRAVFDVLVGVLSKVGEFIVGVFENPKQALIDLANLVKNNIINRFTAFKVILEGIIDLDFKKVGNGLLQAATGVENATDKARALAKNVKDVAVKAIDAAAAAAKLKGEFQDLEDATRNNLTTLSKNQVLIDTLLAKSKNRTLSEKERFDILKQAGDLEKQNLQSRLDLANKEISLTQQEVNLKKAAGTLRDEDEQKLADAIVNRDNLQRESFSLQERLEGRMDLLKQQGEAKRLAAIEKKRVAEEKADKKSEERDKLRQEITKAFLESQQKGLKTQQEVTKQLFDSETNSLKDSLIERNITQKEFETQTTELKFNNLQKQLMDLVDFNGVAGDLTQEIGAKQIEIDTFITDNKLANLAKIRKQEEDDLAKAKVKLAEKLKITEDFTASVGDIIGQSITETGFDLEEFNKKFLILLLDTAEKVLFATVFKTTAESLASAGSIATFGVAGLVKAAIITGLIKGAFSVLKSQINSFHEGGFTGGGKEWDIAGNVHKEEFVFTKEKTKKHRKLFEAIHSDSPVSMPDLAKLLSGTGVIMRPEATERINSMHAQLSSGQVSGSPIEKKLSDIENRLKVQFDKQNNKEHREIAPDGTITIKKGSTTRIIRKNGSKI